MHFGKAIVLSFILFAAFIGVLVFICVRQDINLVSKDYYREELDYQHKLDQMNNTLLLQQKPVITVSKGQVRIELEGLSRVEKGLLKLSRPSNALLDQVFRLKPVAGNFQEFVLDTWEPGLYRASLTWAMEGKEYYFEKLIVL